MTVDSGSFFEKLDFGQFRVCYVHVPHLSQINISKDQVIGKNSVRIIYFGYVL